MKYQTNVPFWKLIQTFIFSLPFFANTVPKAESLVLLHHWVLNDSPEEERVANKIGPLWSWVIYTLRGQNETIFCVLATFQLGCCISGAGLGQRAYGGETAALPWYFMILCCGPGVQRAFPNHLWGAHGRAGELLHVQRSLKQFQTFCTSLLSCLTYSIVSPKTHTHTHTIYQFCALSWILLWLAEFRRWK